MRRELNLHHLLHHFDTLTLEGLSPSTKRDIQKFIQQRNSTSTDSGIGSFLKYTLIATLVLSLIFCLLYSIYRWYKNKTPQFQPNPALAAYGGYGAYQQNYPVMAAPQYGQYAQVGGQLNQFGQLQGVNYGGAGQPVGAGVGFVGNQNQQKVRNQPARLKSPKLKEAKDRDFLQSVTWKLDTQGKGR